MRALLKISLLAIATAGTLYVSSVNAQVSDYKNSFWNTAEEGWFWYKKDPEPVKPKKKKEEEPKIIAETKPEEKKPEEPAMPQAPAVFSAAWVRENLKVFKEVAWNEPTVENLRAYLYLQRFAIDRSEQFAYAGQLAMMADPFLDETARTPNGGGIFSERQLLLDGVQHNILKKFFKKVGVLFFFKNDCYICNMQAQVLQYANRTLGVEVQAVSIDTPDKNSIAAQIFPDYEISKESIQAYKLKALPATFFINTETKEVKPLVQGFLTLNDISKRSVITARNSNWLPPDDLQQLKPVDDITSLSSLLTEDSELARTLTKLKSQTNPLGKDTNYINSKDFVREIIKYKESKTPEDFIPRGF